MNGATLMAWRLRLAKHEAPLQTPAREALAQSMIYGPKDAFRAATGDDRRMRDARRSEFANILRSRPMSASSQSGPRSG